MNRVQVSTAGAPAALGPYSQAIVAGGFVFCSGTVGIDPQSGVLAEGIGEQTEQALVNLAAILEASGSSMSRLVKTTIFYANVDEFATINEVYARHMPDPPPRSVGTGECRPATGHPDIDRSDRPSGA